MPLCKKTYFPKQKRTRTMPNANSTTCRVVGPTLDAENVVRNGNPSSNATIWTTRKLT